MSDPRTWRAVAWIALLFCLAVAATMAWQHRLARESDPWKSPRLLWLKSELAAHPKDEEIKQTIREMDLVYRQRFFRSQVLLHTGAKLLLLGAVVALFAAHRARKLSHVPAPPSAPMRDESGKARWALGTLALMGVGLLLWGSDGKVEPTAVPEDLVAPKETLPSQEEFLANWPRFHGPTGDGRSSQTTAPPQWSETENIVWKTPVSRVGFNSPIVWGERVFLSGGDAKERAVMAYSAADGSLLWERVIADVPGSPAKPPYISDMVGYAPSTMATDGRRVYVIFANGDLAALTLEGEPVWSRHLGVPKNQYGHASSLGVWRGKLIVQFDQGEYAPANSRLMVFDGATGDVVWEAQRRTPNTWTTPVAGELDGRTVIVAAGLPAVSVYDFETGEVLWSAAVLEGEVTPSPIFAGGYVIVVIPNLRLIALKPDGAEAWRLDGDAPDVSTPATDGSLIYHASSSGVLTCVDARSGERLWKHDFGAEVQASPAVAAGRVYVISTTGKMWVVEAGREFKEVGGGELSDSFSASPAFAHRRMYLRGTGHLYCIEGEPKK